MEFRPWSKEEFEKQPKPFDCWIVRSDGGVTTAHFYEGERFPYPHLKFGDVIPTPEVRIVERPPELTEQQKHNACAEAGHKATCSCGINYGMDHASPKPDAVSTARDALIEALDLNSTAWRERFVLLQCYLKAERAAAQEGRK